MAILTNARLALWKAIDDFPGLASGQTGTNRVFRQTLRFDATGTSMRDVIEPNGLAEFPCLAIHPSVIDPSWATHEMMNFATVEQVLLWTEGWSLPQPEDLIEKIWQAIHKQGKSATLSHVKEATGYHPTLIRPIEFAFVKLGKEQTNKATRVTLRVGLRCQQDPFA